MKKLLFITLLLVLIVPHCIIAQVSFNNYKDGNIYMFNDTFKLLNTEIFEEYKSQFGLSNDDAMVLVEQQFIRVDTTDSIDAGSVQARYKQTYKGYDVEGKLMNVLTKCNVVLAAGGELISDLDIDVSSPISEENALDSILAHLNADFYPWLTPLEDSLKVTTEDSNATYKPKGWLIVAPKIGEEYEDIPENYTFCWKFNVPILDTVDNGTSIDTLSKYIAVYVNANTGEIYNVFSQDMEDYCVNSATYWTWYYGYTPNSLQTKTCNLCTRYKLADCDRHISTYDTDDGNVPIKDNNNNWVDDDQKTAVQGQWVAARTYDYFKNAQGITHGNELKIVTPHKFDSYNSNAGWGPRGTGDVEDRINIREDRSAGPISGAGFDVIAHEFTHRMIFRSSQVGRYKDRDAFAINEAFADIFGMLAERWQFGSADWSMGEDVGYNRYFDHPENDVPWVSSQRYLGTDWNSHYPYSHGGPLRKWFNHLSEGAASWSNPSAGIGMDNAGRLAFIAMYWWLWPQANYWDLRNATLAVAKIHYGGVCGKAWCAVEKSWNDVGLGTTSPCNPLKLRSANVVLVDQVNNSSMKPARFVVSPTYGYEESFTVLSYTWLAPAHWTGTLSNGNATYTLTDISENTSSQSIACVVAYQDKNATTVYDTLTTVIHFCTDCLDSTIGNKSSQLESQHPNIKNWTKVNDKIVVYPNPTTGRLNIVMPTNADADCNLFDVTGKNIYHSILHEGNNSISLPPFPAGTYILKIMNEKLNFVERIQLR